MDTIRGHWQPHNIVITNQLHPHSGQNIQIIFLPQQAEMENFQLQKYIFISIFQTFCPLIFPHPSKPFSSPPQLLLYIAQDIAYNEVIGNLYPPPPHGNIEHKKE